MEREENGDDGIGRSQGPLRKRKRELKEIWNEKSRGKTSQTEEDKKKSSGNTQKKKSIGKKNYAK